MGPVAAAEYWVVGGMTMMMWAVRSSSGACTLGTVLYRGPPTGTVQRSTVQAPHQQAKGTSRHSTRYSTEWRGRGCHRVVAQSQRASTAPRFPSRRDRSPAAADAPRWWARRYKGQLVPPVSWCGRFVISQLSLLSLSSYNLH